MSQKRKPRPKKGEAKGTFPSVEHRFKAGQSGNPFGRPKKLMSTIVTQLKEAGYERVGQSTMQHTMETLLGLPEDILQAMAIDSDAPIATRILAAAIMNRQERLPLLLEVLDRIHGKAPQHIVNHAGGVLLPKPVRPITGSDAGS